MCYGLGGEISAERREDQLAQGTAIAGVREGDVLAGKYRVDRVLGLGGMGVVVAAHHIHLDDRVAIKFLLPEMLGSKDVVDRFLREARAAVRIKNEHVARVTDVGTLENGAPYMVMEYLDGSDLAGWLRERGPLPIEQAVEFLLQACVAIADAHGLGIVHRDLKPANLFCIRQSDGQFSIKVLDFGISKLIGPAGSGTDMSMTKTAAVMGSPLYMSPEQMQSSRDVDSRTDIWALGVVLFELLTGKVPFSGATLPEICVTIATKPPPPLRQLRDDAPAALERAINKCLEKDRGQRYRNVAELAYALVEFAPKRGRVSAEKVAGIIQGAGLAASAEAQPSSYENDRARSPGTLASWGQKTAPPPAGRRGWLAIVMAAVILVAGFAGAVLLKRNRELQNEPTVVVASELAVAPSSSDHPLSTSANVLPVVVAPTSPPAGAAAVPIPDPPASVFKAPPLPEGVLKRSGPAIRPAKPAPEKRSEAIADPPAPPSSHVAPPAPPPVRAPPPADPADLGGRL